MNIRDFFVLRTSKTLYSDVLPYIHNAFIANGTLRERVLAADIYTMDPSHGSVVHTPKNRYMETFSDVSMSAISLDLYMI